MRNAAIFDHTIPGVKGTCIKAVAFFKERGLIKEKMPKRNFCLKDIWSSFPGGFFDGALPFEHCGSGVVIVSRPGNYFSFGWFSGKGSNMRAELLGWKY